MADRILITGGAGFIGSHLCDALLADGHQVHVLDDLSTGRINNIRHLKSTRRFDYTIDSCANRAVVAELVDDADVVFHLAAAVGVELIVESPVRTIETNVHCTEVVLAQANKKKKPVLIASTSEVYGKTTALPLPRGRRPGAWARRPRALGLRLLEGDRRVPRAGLLEGAQAADGRRPAVQHRRPAPDRPLRHGRPALRPRRRWPSATSVYGDGTQTPLLLPRRRRRARAGRRSWPTTATTARSSTSARRRRSRSASSPSGSSRRRAPSPRSSRCPTRRPTKRASRTCAAACRTPSKIRAAIGWSHTSSLDQIVADVIAHEQTKLAV